MKLNERKRRYIDYVITSPFSFPHQIIRHGKHLTFCCLLPLMLTPAFQWKCAVYLCESMFPTHTNTHTCILDIHTNTHVHSSRMRFYFEIPRREHGALRRRVVMIAPTDRRIVLVWQANLDLCRLIRNQTTLRIARRSRARSTAKRKREKRIDGRSLAGDRLLLLLLLHDRDVERIRSPSSPSSVLKRKT